MRTTEKTIQRRIALALAHLCDPKDGKLIFVDNNGNNLIYTKTLFLLFLLFLINRFITNAGIEFLLELLYLSSMKHQKYSSRALFELARKATSFAPEDSAPSSPTQRVRKLHIFFKFKNYL